MFFILDNFEHLLAGADLVSEIITAAPGIRILVTSRERLHLLQEQLYPILGLEFPDWDTAEKWKAVEQLTQYTAVQLFLGAARRVRPDFQLTADDLACLTRICHLVGGMPLALELAAGWVDLLPLSEIADEIERSLSFLEMDLRDVPDRQRSIQAVFAKTWERLETAEQEIMQKLAVFRGSFTREAVHVAANQLPAARLLRLLSGLVSKSLLQANTDRQRYRIHELVRQFARERLEESGELAGTRTAHSNYFLNLLQQREGDIKGGREQKQALDEIELDFANVRAAWFWALDRGNLAAIDQSLESLFWYFWFHSRQIDGMSLFERTLAQLAKSPNGDISLLQRRLAVRRLYLDRGANLIDPAEKLRDVEKILAETEKVGTKEEIAFAYHTLGHAQIDFGGPQEFDFPAIMDSFSKSLTLYRAMNESFYEGQVLDWLSVVYFTSGEPDERVRIAKERLSMAEKRGDRLTIADTMAQIGVDHELAGRYDDAEEKYREALPVFKEYGDRWHQTEYLLRLSGLAFLKGDFEQAKLLTEEGQATVNRYNLLSVEPHIVEHLAMVLCAEEAYDQVIEISVMPKLHFYQPTVFALDRGLMLGYCGVGNFPAARENLRGALKTASLMKASGWLVQCVVGAALIAAGEERFERAAELLSLAYHHPAGATGWLEKLPLIIQLRQRLEAELGAEAYTAAGERGQRLELETAVSLVRSALSQKN
jgi:predicted ATPase